MPFYEYECAHCKAHTEALQKITDPPLRKCPSCGRSTLKKLVSAPIFRLKGGGWYETDFKSDKENKRNLAVDKEPESKGDASKPKDDKKPADSKPAEAAKPAPVATKSASKSKPKAKPAAKRRSRR